MNYDKIRFVVEQFKVNRYKNLKKNSYKIKELIIWGNKNSKAGYKRTGSMEKLTKDYTTQWEFGF